MAGYPKGWTIFILILCIGFAALMGASAVILKHKIYTNPAWIAALILSIIITGVSPIIFIGTNKNK